MVSVPAGPRTQYMDIAPPSLGFPPSEKKYAYPRESDQTIVEELDKIGITEIRIQDLDHPNQQIVLTCFSAFLEDLSYVDDAVVKSIKDYNLQKEVADHAEIYDESMQFIIRFNEIRALMISSRFPDFTISDITRPKPMRFKKQICALLNFHHFHKREKLYWDEFYEDWKKQEEQLFIENERLNEKLPKLRLKVELKRKEQEKWKESSQIEEALRLRNLKSEMIEEIERLVEERDRLLGKHEKVQEDVQSIEKKRDKVKFICQALTDEIEKLQIRIEVSPTQLRDVNESQRERIRSKELASLEEEKKSRSLAQKKRVLEGLERDIEVCKQLVNECIEDQIRLTKENQDLETIQIEKAVMTKEKKELEARLALAEERLNYAIERLERIRHSLETKREENKRKSEEANQRREEAHREKRSRSDKVDEIYRQVAKMESEFEKITGDFDLFYSELLEQKDRLEKQSLEYMQAVSQRMDLQVDVL